MLPIRHELVLEKLTTKNTCGPKMLHQAANNPKNSAKTKCQRDDAPGAKSIELGEPVCAIFPQYVLILGQKGAFSMLILGILCAF